MSALSRRASLGAVLAAAGVPAVAAASSAAHPDAEPFRLRDLCRELDRSADALPYGPAREEAFNVMYAEVRRLSDARWEMAHVPAHTAAGLRAKAETMWPNIDPGLDQEPDGDTVLAWSLCRDLLGLNGGAA